MSHPVGLVAQEIANSNVMTYVLTDALRPTVDAWAEHMSAYFERYPNDEPIFILMDVTQASVAFTPYFRAKSTYLIRTHNRLGKMAFVFPNMYILRVVMFFMQLEKKRFTARGFTEYEPALAWLLEA